MLHLTASGDMERLAAELAGLLAEPQSDPMLPEWIVVLTPGTQRWLRLCLARTLGASGSGASDGVAANLDMLFPATFRSRLLVSEAKQGTDPWHLDRLVWAVLDVLESEEGDRALLGLPELPPGGTRWRRARRIADLFDRYAVHRPRMLGRWTAGEDVDGNLEPLPQAALWQPHLWRLVRERIGEPSPAELLPDRLADLRAGNLPASMPERVALFGLSGIPGGQSFLDLLDAVATRREVYGFFHRPSPGMAGAVCALLNADRLRQGTTSDSAPLRSEDRSSQAVAHPLLRSWGRPSREAEVLLAGREVRLVGADGTSEAPEHSPNRPSSPEPATLLARIQQDLRTGESPGANFEPSVGDRSVRFHSCHGTTRQVEVLRDEILHLLANDATLTEDDIVVMCPSIEEYAVFVEAVLGPSGDGDTQSRGRMRGQGVAATGEPGSNDREGLVGLEGPPRLRYRITDRSIRDTSPLFGAVAVMLDLLDSRFSAPALIDFASQPPVRERFGFDDSSLRVLTDWLARANVSWGLDGGHRERWHVPADYTAGTWRFALDRILMGTCTSDDEGLDLSIGDVLPLGVEGVDIELAGQFAELIRILASLADRCSESRSAGAWAQVLQEASDALFRVDDRAAWQRQRLRALLVELAGNSEVADRNVDVDLTLSDIRRWFSMSLPTSGGRPDFFRGGVVITSLTPLRGVPHRVVCLLGMDESAFGTRFADGDDLTSMSPVIGDHDKRAEMRLALLEAVLSARDNLVVMRTGRNVVTNQEVPNSVPVAELKDTVTATLSPAVRDETWRRLELVHPRQAFDERNFGAARSDHECRFQVDGPWSFDPVARDGAEARISGRGVGRSLLDQPLDLDPELLIDLADLRSFLEHPVAWFLRNSLRITLPDPPERSEGAPVRVGGPSGPSRPSSATGAEIPISLDGLAAWSLRDRLLRQRRLGLAYEDIVERELASGVLPPGRLGRAELETAIEAVEPLLDAATSLGVGAELPMSEPVEVVLPNGVRILGQIADERGERPGPVRITASKRKHKNRLAPWLDLMMLVAWKPEVPWWSVLVSPGSGSGNSSPFTEVMEIGDADPEVRREVATDALQVVVDLFQRGRREPLPLFPTLSNVLHGGARQSAAASAWSPFKSRGDKDDRWIALAFDNPTLDQILNLPLRNDDPDGPGGSRAQRYAELLWGVVGRTVGENPTNASPKRSRKSRP